MAGGLAWGLKQTYANNPDVDIIDISKGLSGFVRDDVKNWPRDISAQIDEIKPMAVVFLGGMNDRQEMRLSAGRVRKLSEPWITAYTERTQTLASSIEVKKLPFIWVGLPPVKPGSMTRDYLRFNEIYRTRVEASGGTYVDVWDGFTNAEGKYVSAGPDVNGQIKRLRASDGINMNNTGKRKLAFYVNVAIKKLTALGTPTFVVSLPDIETSRPIAPQYDPAKSGKTVVYSLAGPNLDGGSTLAGGDSPDINKENAKTSISYDLVNSGTTPKPYPGRVDNYGPPANQSPTETKKVEKQADAGQEKTAITQ